MRKSFKNHISAAFLAGIMLMPVSAQAGSNNSSPYLHLSIEEAADFSKKIEKELAANGARIAIVFRSGRAREDLPDNVKYTHGAFWVYQPIRRQDGSIKNGYVVYNLFHGDGESLPRTKSFLATDFPFEFTASSGVDDVGIVIPTLEMQKRIWKIISSDDYEALHVDNYSLIANPHNATNQNCAEFMLDVISSAAWQTTDYNQLKANLKEHFVPTKIETSRFKRFFAPMADERLKMNDQKGGVQTVTYSSIAEFMKKFDMTNKAYAFNYERPEAKQAN